MTDPSNILSTSGLLNHNSTILELGCGVSGLLSLALAPKVKSYIATDQNYVLKILRQNIETNRKSSRNQRQTAASHSSSRSKSKSVDTGNIQTKTIDWETDDITSLFSELEQPLDEERIDFVLACDCIYNESLVDPFVDTCAQLCRLAVQSSPTLCIVAQQLRSPDVFELWLKAFHRQFRAFRIPSRHLSTELGEDSGFVVHIGILRDSPE